MSQAPYLYAGRHGIRIVFMCFVFAHRWLMRDITVFLLEHKMFYPLSLPSGTWSTATIEVATRAENSK